MIIIGQSDPILMPLLYWTHFEVKKKQKSELKSRVKKSHFCPNPEIPAENNPAETTCVSECSTHNSLPGS